MITLIKTHWISYVVDYDKLLAKCIADSHKIAMLICLYENGQMKKSEVYKCIPPNNRRAQKLDELQESGLIVMDNKKFEMNTTYVQLTDLGKEIAKMLIDVELRLRDVGSIAEHSEKKEAFSEEDIEARIEKEVNRRLAEKLKETEEDDYISAPGAVLSSDEEKEE